MTYLFTHWSAVGGLTLEHLGLVGGGLLLGAIVALPLGVLAARVRRLSAPIFAVLAAIYTIPSLALLALAVQYVGIGYAPVVLVLAAYAQFILARTVAAALNGVPEAIVDAARGMGMNPLQRLIRVELPLALPELLGGVRLTTIALIAIATLGGYVGAGGLGSYIFFGLQREYIAQTLAGSIPAAVLAILVDLFVRRLETISSWSSGRIAADAPGRGSLAHRAS